jgi:hypothetical protein
MFKYQTKNRIQDGELGSTEEIGNNGAFLVPFESFTLRPEFAVYRHLRTRDPCSDGVFLPTKLKIHRHMNCRK